MVSAFAPDNEPGAPGVEDAEFSRLLMERLEALAADALANEHQRNLLADVLGRMLVKLNVTNDVPMTGPELLAAAEDWLRSEPSSSQAPSP